jgi:hypothetical protein
MFCTCAGLGLIGAIADGVGEVRRAVREPVRNGANQIKIMAGGVSVARDIAHRARLVAQRDDAFAIDDHLALRAQHALAAVEDLGVADQQAFRHGLNRR